MAGRGLIEGECGGPNSLVKLTSHFVQDRGLKQEAYGAANRFPPPKPYELVGEFLSSHHTAMAPQTFHMGSLLQEMREIEGAEMIYAPQRAPGIAELATAGNWTEEFLATSNANNKHIPGSNDQWAAEFGRLRGAEEVKWAHEYLENGDHGKLADEYLSQLDGQVWSSEYEKELLDDTKWVDEYSLHQSDKELEQTANALLGSITDPKINESEFMKFVKKIGDGEISIKDNQVIDKSMDELAEAWSHDFTSSQA
ncbi:unnamed protein product, partial [Candidula unifasciata]